MTLVDGYDLVILDLDGVVYLGSEPVPGAVAALESVAARGIPVRYVTNNASRTAAEVATLLNGLGLRADPGDVVTSAAAAAEQLATDLPAGAPVLVVGAPALVAEIAAVGLTPVDRADAGPVAVVQGYGAGVGWAQFAEACVAVRAGARWVATNLDATLPSPRGPLPGNGSLVAAVATALGRGPDLVVGKPSPELFRSAASRCDARRPLVVGDRADTDLAGARAAGMAGLLVLTGVTEVKDVPAIAAPARPTYIANDLSGLSHEDDELRVPPPAAEVSAGGWRARRVGSEIVLAGAGARDAAARVLAAVAWAGPAGATLTPDGPAAVELLTRV